MPISPAVAMFALSMLAQGAKAHGAAKRDNPINIQQSSMPSAPPMPPPVPNGGQMGGQMMGAQMPMYGGVPGGGGVAGMGGNKSGLPVTAVADMFTAYMNRPQGAQVGMMTPTYDIPADWTGSAGALY